LRNGDYVCTVSDISSDSYIREHSYDDSGNYYTLEKESRPIPETARYILNIEYE